MPKVCLRLILISFFFGFIFAFSVALPITSLTPHLAVCRSGHGEHRRDLRGAGVRPAGGYLHGGAGVCLDVKAGAGK